MRHPRWSQAQERRIGEFAKRKTLTFHGCADEAGHLYAGMDLIKYYWPRFPEAVRWPP